MRMVKPGFDITFHKPEGYDSMEQFLEEVARTCYKSEDKITEDSAERLISALMHSGHLAMIEHCTATVRFIADRGFSHEEVRHRIPSFAQESTRYVNYTKGKHGAEITVVALPEVEGMTQHLRDHWKDSARMFEEAYFKAEWLAKKGGIKKPAEIARMFLPIGVKTEIVVTTNLREWNLIFSLRADEPAHPIMRELSRAVLREFYSKIPTIYGPIYRKVMPMEHLTDDERREALAETMQQIGKLQLRADKLSASIDEPGSQEDEDQE